MSAPAASCPSPPGLHAESGDPGPVLLVPHLPRLFLPPPASGPGSPSQHPFPYLLRLSSCVLSPARVWAGVQGIRGIASASGDQAAPVPSFALRQGRHRLAVRLWGAAGPWGSRSYGPVLLRLPPNPSYSAAPPCPQHTQTLGVNPEGLTVEKEEDGVRVCRPGLCGLK